MWRLWHKLFGWDYIYWTNSADSGLARVYFTHDGKIWYWRYRCTEVIDRIYTPDQVLWLTCPASKYFPEFRQTENKNAVKDQCL